MFKKYNSYREADFNEEKCKELLGTFVPSHIRKDGVTVKSYCKRNPNIFKKDTGRYY